MARAILPVLCPSRTIRRWFIPFLWNLGGTLMASTTESDSVWLLGLYTKWQCSFCLGCALSRCVPLGPNHHALRNSNLPHSSVVLSILSHTNITTTQFHISVAQKEILSNQFPSFPHALATTNHISYLYGFAYYKHFI